MSVESPRRILITGVSSIHGWPIYRFLTRLLGADRVVGFRPPAAPDPQSENIFAVSLLDRRELEEWRRDLDPEFVLHAGGVCDLDVCEARPDWAEELNVSATRSVADVFGPSARLIYFSTDLVFRGDPAPALGYDESAPRDPISVVGKTFARAEDIVREVPRSLVLRLGLPMGDSIQGNKGAVDWIESRFRRRLPVTLFYDELRGAIDCEELARVVGLAMDRRLEGLFHIGGPVPVSLYRMGELVASRGNYDPGLLFGRLRREEIGGPPRVGNVFLDCRRVEEALGQRISPCAWWTRPRGLDFEGILARADAAGPGARDEG
jgi:dTDP-4-dehydrorhamnose reductase